MVGSWFRMLSVWGCVGLGADLEFLEAILSRLERAFADPNCPPRDLVALARRIVELRREIRLIEGGV